MIYIVFGVAQSGSGSLTYPEDFTFYKACTSEEDARAVCLDMNVGVLKTHDVELEDGETYEDLASKVDAGKVDFVQHDLDESTPWYEVVPVPT